MSDTNVQKCNCCETETDCINGLCEPCSVYNFAYEEAKKQLSKSSKVLRLNNTLMTDMTEKIAKLQKQSDLLTLGLLQEKGKVSSVQNEFSKAVTGNDGYIYPKDICKSLPPEQYKGWNACLSCRFSPVCKLLFATPQINSPAQSMWHPNDKNKS